MQALIDIQPAFKRAAQKIREHKKQVALAERPRYQDVHTRLQRAPTLYEIEQDQIWLNLHAGQGRAWDSARRIIAMIAGSQGGKTSFGPWWLYREIQRHGAGDYIAATATYD